MSGWLTFWEILLVVSLAVFAVLVVLVTIGGFRDIRSMFRALDEQHETLREE